MCITIARVYYKIFFFYSIRKQSITLLQRAYLKKIIGLRMCINNLGFMLQPRKFRKGQVLHESTQGGPTDTMEKKNLRAEII